MLFGAWLHNGLIRLISMRRLLLMGESSPIPNHFHHRSYNQVSLPLSPCTFSRIPIMARYEHVC